MSEPTLEQKKAIAEELAERMGDFLPDGWLNEAVENTQHSDEVKAWAKDHVRWTMIDDYTGDDFLGGEDKHA